MGRKKLVEGEKTVTQDFKLARSQKRELRRHAKRLGRKPAEICRAAVLKWLRQQNRHERKLDSAKEPE